MKKITLEEKEVEELVRFYEAELKKTKKRVKELENLIQKLKGNNKPSARSRPLPERVIIEDDDEEVVIINPASHKKS
ncbi:hypothetical protein R9C00_21665 [Flammeovirgaceae bacterium SG7u.111]|nr:hypothetical protein [Flammeovirgaceae bacterium SG7u.132]WPO34310.1 hypothetical protein R9C00_21665 [Flammeovirgaceae bacterium SG7u.111]